MKAFFSEFKEFIQRGNVMDMAIGVAIGGAFTAIVTSLTTDVLNPVIQMFTKGGGDTSFLNIEVADGVILNFSAFISAIINFLIVALVLFLVIRSLNKFSEKSKKIVKKDGDKEVEMNPPVCPFCLEEVKEGALRCPHCAGGFEEPAVATPVEEAAEA